jgi:HD-GYP domain-containing protein (c-di-GMP phosphodiesterase class II)
MLKQVLQVPVQKLTKGLYVLKLDRPWLDSPFEFQGFKIESDEQLQQLRQLCSNVYVELTQADADKLLSNPAALPARRRENPLKSLDEVSKNLNARLDSVPERDPVSLKSELTQAKKTYDEARKTVNQMFERLRRGGGLDLQLVEGAVDSMVQSLFRNRDAMGWLARMREKDDYLYNHSLAASVWALAFGRHLGLERDTLRLIGMGAMVLDIGKMQLPLSLLNKSGKPDEGEWKILRGHVQLGLDLLNKDINADACVKQMVELHHERLDGSGYPHGLQGDAIPLVGRIAAIVDCYDAMTSPRPYAKPLSTYDAVRELKTLGKTWFQPELVELFIQAVGVFPSGTLVELNSGEVAVVITQNRFRRLRPEVMLLLDAGKKPRNDFELIDLQQYARDNANGHPELWITKGLEPGAYGIDPTEYFL